MFKIVLDSVKLEGQARTTAYRARIVKEEILRTVTTLTTITRSVLVKNSPSVTGVMRNSWQQDVFRRAKSTVGMVSTTQVSAKVFEDGAKQHFPPITKFRIRIGKRGRKRLVGVGIPNVVAQPALAPWIRKRLGITDKRLIAKAAFFIGMKFKKQGRPVAKRWSAVLALLRPGYSREFERMMLRIVARFGSKT